MRIDPAIAALQRDPALQRQVQLALIDACSGWRASPQVAPLADQLVQYGQGAVLDSCPDLRAVMTDAGRAAQFAATFADTFARCLAQDHFGQVPFRHVCDGGVSSLMLLQSGTAHLVLHGREPGHWAHAEAGFSHGDRHELVLAGLGTGVIVGPAGGQGPALPTQPVALVPGWAACLDLRRQALQVESVSRRLVCLRLNRTAPVAAPTRHHARDDGRLLHQSAGNLVTSRQEMMLAILGRMKRHDAVPEMAALAVETDNDQSLRWQALRECLALDAGAGFAALSAVAGDPADPLSAPAAALRSRLAQDHPQLLQPEPVPCPA